MKNPQPQLIAAAVALALAAGSAHAVLERVGPNDNAPSIGGYPAWYQDTTGLALEFCDPKNQAELDGGWCLLLPGDVQAVPESFPTNFFDEHFWFAADAVMTPTSGGKAALILAVEAAFAADVVPGGQIAFSRVRIVLNPVPASGTYRFIHPYGEKTFEAQAGDKIFFTDDVGISCAPGQFDCATQSALGPFLLPADTPGGAELPAIAGPVPGKLYIADPARSGPATGSPLPDFVDSTGALRNHNIFRIEGPVGSGLGVDPLTGATVDHLETTDFTLMGRVFTGALPGRIDPERASYRHDAAGRALDVFAEATPTTQGRRPAEPRPPQVAPQLTFFAAPCAGQVDAQGTVHPPYAAPAGALEHQMLASGSHYWGQTLLAVKPDAVCLKDASARNAIGQITPTYAPLAVTDSVSVTQAYYDTATGTLSVAAQSSEAVEPPTLSLAFGTFRGDLQNGQAAVPNLVAPPGSVRVLSSLGGVGEARVETGKSGGEPPPSAALLARNDAFALDEDAPPQTLAVLANDDNAAGGTVSITAPPRLGTALVNPDGTVSFTPNPNANGLDGFTYTVSVGGQTSNTGNATLDIAPVNDAPTAADDSANAVVDNPVAIGVLANDSDPDGAADLAAAVALTQPVAADPAIPPGSASVSATGGVVTFTAGVAGTYAFSYQAQDAAGATSAPATVTVRVAAAETLGIGRAEYVRSKSRLRAEGTIAPAAGQTVRIDFVNAAGAVVGTAGETIADAAGIWVIDKVVALPFGTSAIRATSSNGTVRSSPLALK